MRELMVPPKLRQSSLSDGQLEQSVTELGLAHALVTQWTSFVAVSEKIVNADPTAAISADVPLPMVKGIRHKAYQKQPAGGMHYASPNVGSNQQNPAVAFSGGSTPEPEHLLGLLVLLLPLGAFLRRNRRVIT
jgi:Ca-activated chloride channel family protein